MVLRAQSAGRAKSSIRSVAAWFEQDIARIVDATRQVGGAAMIGVDIAQQTAMRAADLVGVGTGLAPEHGECGDRHQLS